MVAAQPKTDRTLSLLDSAAALAFLFRPPWALAFGFALAAPRALGRTLTANVRMASPPVKGTIASEGTGASLFAAVELAVGAASN